MDLQKFYIEPKLITDDLLGKRGAEHELAEVKAEIYFCYANMAFTIGIFILPILIVWEIVLLWMIILNDVLHDVLQNGWWTTMSQFFPTLVLSGSAVGFIIQMFAHGYAEDVITEYATAEAEVDDLLDRRKKLATMINVEADYYESSQAREIAPLLLARIRKHNSLIQEGSRIIGLQKTLDRNSGSKLAPQLEQNICKKVEAEHNDLLNRLETYEVMKEMRADMSVGITAALMDVKDFNKSELDEFLTEKQEAMKLLLDNGEDEKILPA